MPALSYLQSLVSSSINLSHNFQEKKTFYKKVSFCKQIARQHSWDEIFVQGRSCKFFPLLYFDHQAKFGCCLLDRVTGSKNLGGRVRPRVLGTALVLHPLVKRVIVPISVALGQTVWARPKIWECGVQPYGTRCA